MGRPKLSYKDLNIHGKIFGRLTVIGDGGRDKKTNKPLIIAKCKCGKIKTLAIASLRYGLSLSCGCYGAERRKQSCTKHGLCSHPLYGIWHGINERCYNKKHASYRYYGAKGVRVCKRWQKDFKNFYDWAIGNGWKRGLYVDKDIKGNGKLYSPEECVIATHYENNKIKDSWRKFTIKGETKTLVEWCKIYNIKLRVAYIRIHEGGWDIERALTQKKQRKNISILAVCGKNKIKFNSLIEAKKQLKIGSDTIRNSIKNNKAPKSGNSKGYKFSYA